MFYNNSMESCCALGSDWAKTGKSCDEFKVFILLFDNYVELHLSYLPMDCEKPHFYIQGACSGYHPRAPSALHLDYRTLLLQGCFLS